MYSVCRRFRQIKLGTVATTGFLVETSDSWTAIVIVSHFDRERENTAVSGVYGILPGMSYYIYRCQ